MAKLNPNTIYIFVQLYSFTLKLKFLDCPKSSMLYTRQQLINIETKFSQMILQRKHLRLCTVYTNITTSKIHKTMLSADQHHFNINLIPESIIYM